MAKTTTLVSALTACFLATTASPPKLRQGNGTNVLRAAQEVLEIGVKETSNRHCSFLFVFDGHSRTISLDEVIGSEGLSSGGAAVFEMARNRVNLTQTLVPRVVAQARRLRLLSWCVTIVVVSDDPVFLAAFAEASDSGRLLVWETRLLVVTRLAMPRLRGLLQGYWTFSMMNTMFLTSKGGLGEERCQLYVHLPYTPAGKQMVQLASWIPGHGLVQFKRHTFFPEKYMNFHAMSLNVAWFSMTPYFMEVTDLDYTTNNVPRYSGRDYEILKAIAGTLNFSINLLFFQRLEHVQRLISHQAYIRPIKLAFMPHLLQIIDYTMFIERATLGFSMAKPTIKPSWHSLYYPLQPVVWASIAASVLLVFTVLMLMNHGEEGQKPEGYLVMKQVVGPLLDEPISGELPRRSTARVVVAAWLIFAFIVGSLYRSNLTASLTVPKYPPRAETLGELLDAGAKITATSIITDFIDGFKESNSLMYRTLSTRVEFVPTSEVGMQETVEGKKAFVFESLNMKTMIAEHFTNKGGSTPLYVARENILPGYCGWPLTPNAPFKSNLDNYIMAFHGAGLIEKWTTDVLTRAQLNNQRQQSKASGANCTIGVKQDVVGINSVATVLTVAHMQGPFFLYLAGAFISVAALLGENFILLCHLGLSTSGSQRLAAFPPTLLP